MKNSIDLSKYSDILTSIKTDNLKIEFLDKLPVNPIDNDGDKIDLALNDNNKCLEYSYDGKLKMYYLIKKSRTLVLFLNLLNKIIMYISSKTNN